MTSTANLPPSPAPATSPIGRGDGLSPRLKGDGLDVSHRTPALKGDGLGLVHHAATAPSDAVTARHRKPQAFSTSAAVIARARDELADLLGYKVDSVSGFEKTDGGWRLTVTALELCRIPATTDVLASYEVLLNEAGDIVNYHRDRRYLRNQVGDQE